MVPPFPPDGREKFGRYYKQGGSIGKARAESPPARYPLPSANEDFCGHTCEPRAQLGRRRRQRSDARPARHPDRGHPPGKAQAGVHAALRRRRLRDRRERRAHLGDRQQARDQEVLPALGLPGRPPRADARGDARAQAQGGHPPCREGHAPPQPARPPAAAQAQGLLRARAPAHGPEARTLGDHHLIHDETPDQPADETPTPTPDEENVEPTTAPDEPPAEGAPEEVPSAES